MKDLRLEPQKAVEPQEEVIDKESLQNSNPQTDTLTIPTSTTMIRTDQVKPTQDVQQDFSFGTSTH